MKHIKLSAIVIAMMFVLTGCVRMNLDINIKENGKVDANMLCAYVEDFASEADLPSDDEITEMESDGWTYKPYSQDGYVGYTVSISDVDMDQLLENSSGSNSALGLDNDEISLTKEDSKYVFDASLLDEDDAYEMKSYKSYIDEYGGYMKVVLHVPGKVINSNATSVSSDGKTLTWDLLAMNPGENIHAEFKAESSNIGLIFGIIAVLLVLLVILLFLKKRGNNKKEEGIINSQEKTEETDNVQEMQVETVSETGNTDKAVFCPQCGAKLEEGALFCTKCGKKI